jgi:hypothetical protein
MSDIEILKEMIRNLAIVPLIIDKPKNKVILSEPPPANYSVTINGIPDQNNVIVIKTDAFKSPDTIFQGSHGECKRADFVIIANTEKKKVILCIELKAGKGGQTHEILQQLEGAKCFAEYCKEIGKSFWNQPKFLNGYEYRFVSIKKVTSTRKSSITESGISSDSKIKFLVRKGSFFEFDDLIKCKR